MAYQDYPSIYHGALVQASPVTLTVKNAPKVGVAKTSGRTYRKVQLLLDDGSGETEHTHWIENEDCQAFFNAHVGQRITIQASGGGKGRENTAKIELVGTGGAAAQPQRSAAPQQSAPAKSGLTARDCRTYLAQASNLMRICVKKADDIASDFSLPPEHRQGIATTLFINADRMGFLQTMQLEPYTPQDLGYGTQTAPQQHAQPAPAPEPEPQYEEEDQIPF